MGNVELPWDYDPSLKIDFAPSEEYPPVCQSFFSLRSEIHSIPLFRVTKKITGDNGKLRRRG